jgi:hypothetical protein
MTAEIMIEDFEACAGLAGDVLTDHRDIDALGRVADAICLRNRLALGGTLGALGPVELAQLCDGLGGRADGIELILACRALAGDLGAATVERLEQAIKRVERGRDGSA